MRSGRDIYSLIRTIGRLLADFKLVAATQTAQTLETCVPGELAPSQVVSPQAARLDTAAFSHLALGIRAQLEKT